MRGRRGRRGQALIEVAIASPLLIVMLAGGAQFGSLAYGQITVDTAAREGARTAISSPVSSLGSFFSKSTTTTYHCSGPGDSNPVCQAVLTSPGNLGILSFQASRFAITLTANQPAAGPWSRLPEDGMVLVSACAGTTVKGSVTLPGGGNASGATVSASGSGVTGTSTNTNGSGAYTLCLGIPISEGVTVSASLTTGGCTQTGQVIQTLPSSGTVTGVNVTLGACPTPTPAPSPTPLPTPPSTSPPTPSSLPTATPYTCTPAQRDLDGTYVSVTVTYQMPIFIPFVGQLFADSGNSGVRTVRAEVTMRVEPCTATQGH